MALSCGAVVLAPANSAIVVKRQRGVAREALAVLGAGDCFQRCRTFEQRQPFRREVVENDDLWHVYFLLLFDPRRRTEKKLEIEK